MSIFNEKQKQIIMTFSLDNPWLVLGVIVGLSITFVIAFYPIITQTKEHKQFMKEEDEQFTPTMITQIVERTTVGLTNPSQRVPLTLGFDMLQEVIGYAQCKIKEGLIVADMTIVDHKVNVKGLYPAIGGKVLEMNEDGVITKFELLQVALCVNGNQDPTIKAL